MVRCRILVVAKIGKRPSIAIISNQPSRRHAPPLAEDKQRRRRILESSKRRKKSNVRSVRERGIQTILLAQNSEIILKIG